MLSLFVLSGCEFKDITLKEVKSVEIESFNAGHIKGTVQLVIHNPNWFPVTVKSADLEIVSEALKLGEARLDEAFRINANASETYPIKLSGDIGNALSGGIVGLLGMITGKDPQVTLKGELKASGFFVNRTVPIEVKTTLPVNSLRGL